MDLSRLGILAVLAVSFFSCGAGEEPVAADREVVPNPFGLPGVPGFNDQEVLFYAAVAELAGDAEDDNAPQWSEVGIAGQHESIDGEWSSRWNAEPPNEEWHPGTARIQSVGDRVFIHFQGEYEYSIETVREGDRLVGRYVATADANVTLPWVGLIVSNERIDGIWPLGRWDFRRGGRDVTEAKAP